MPPSSSFSSAGEVRAARFWLLGPVWQAALTFRPDVVAFRPGHDGFFVLGEEARVFPGTCYDAASSAGGGARAEQGLLGLL